MQASCARAPHWALEIGCVAHKIAPTQVTKNRRSRLISRASQPALGPSRRLPLGQWPSFGSRKPGERPILGCLNFSISRHQMALAAGPLWCAPVAGRVAMDLAMRGGYATWGMRGSSVERGVGCWWCERGRAGGARRTGRMRVRSVLAAPPSPLGGGPQFAASIVAPAFRRVGAGPVGRVRLDRRAAGRLSLLVGLL